jgi:diadenylate cyclase
MLALTALLPSLPLDRLNARAVLDILIIAVLIFYLLKLLRGTGVQILVALLLIFLLDEGARWARLGMVEWLLTTLLPYVAIALIVLFQPEIRRALARFGRGLSLGHLLGQNPGSPYDDLVLASAYFSQNRIGALVVIERDVSLNTYTESGIALDANLSYDLLIAIFHPGSPMHDGAVILRGDRIRSAACFLPLSLNSALSNKLGTRHRAAIGITEESDAIGVLVSEETGAISIATGGAIELNITSEQLQERLISLTVRRRQTLVGASAAAETQRK